MTRCATRNAAYHIPRSLKLFQALVEYVVFHFKAEEEGFSAHHYEHEVAHKAIHQKFLADATAAVAGGVNPGIIAFLKDWLVTHIKGESVGHPICEWCFRLNNLFALSVHAGSDMKYKGVL